MSGVVMIYSASAVYAEYLYDNFYGDIDENRLGDPRDIVIFNPNSRVFDRFVSYIDIHLYQVNS